VASEFWQEVEKEIEESKEEWKFKAEQFRELQKHPGWLIFIQLVNDWLLNADNQILSLGMKEESPNMFKMGYLHGIKEALTFTKNIVSQTIEEELTED